MFTCSHCDAQSLKWQGRCSECGKWGTLSEEVTSVTIATSSQKSKQTNVRPAAVLDLSHAKATALEYRSTTISELDRVLSGGIVPGAVLLLAGEPGVGKSTLVAQIASAAQIGEKKALYVSGEESEGQVIMRFQRLGISADNILFSNTIDIPSIIAAANKEQPSLLIIDSIQTMIEPDSGSLSGTPTSVRAATAQLVSFAKSTGTPVLIIGQITKEGVVAGPKTLEHLVDTVLTLEGDKRSSYRMLRANKNRFGSTDEVGIFEMTEKGMVGVENPSARFLEERSTVAGSAVTCVMEGTRPLLVEVQALVEQSYFANPVRRTSGFDSKRLQMLLAIISKRAGVKIANQDVYVNVVGGMKLKEYAADLAICAAVISSAKDKPVPNNTLFVGELGLGGEIRSVPFLDRRLKEAKRLGIGNAVTPKTTKHIKDIL